MLNSHKFMTHTGTRMKRKIASINKAEDKKIHLWGPYGTPLGMLKVNSTLLKYYQCHAKAGKVSTLQSKKMRKIFWKTHYFLCRNDFEKIGCIIFNVQPD